MSDYYPCTPYQDSGDAVLENANSRCTYSPTETVVAAGLQLEKVTGTNGAFDSAFVTDEFITNSGTLRWTFDGGPSGSDANVGLKPKTLVSAPDYYANEACGGITYTHYTLGIPYASGVVHTIATPDLARVALYDGSPYYDPDITVTPPYLDVWTLIVDGTDVELWRKATSGSAPVLIGTGVTDGTTELHVAVNMKEVGEKVTIQHFSSVILRPT